MKRTNVHLSEPQLVDLKKAARALDLSLAEFIRRLIDEWRAKEKEKKR